MGAPGFVRDTRRADSVNPRAGGNDHVLVGRPSTRRQRCVFILYPSHRRRSSGRLPGAPPNAGAGSSSAPRAPKAVTEIDVSGSLEICCVKCLNELSTGTARSWTRQTRSQEARPMRPWKAPCRRSGTTDESRTYKHFTAHGKSREPGRRQRPNKAIGERRERTRDKSLRSVTDPFPAFGGTATDTVAPVPGFREGNPGYWGRGQTWGIPLRVCPGSAGCIFPAPSPLAGEGWGEGEGRGPVTFESPSPQPSPARGEGVREGVRALPGQTLSPPRDRRAAARGAEPAGSRPPARARSRSRRARRARRVPSCGLRRTA